MTPVATPKAHIYFTDFFSVAPEVLEEYGAFNVSLINDLPLFVDPFLLFDSDEPHYRALHDSIIRYVRFLRDVSIESGIHRGLLEHWFRFPEVSHTGWGSAGPAIEGVAWESTLQALFTATCIACFAILGQKRLRVAAISRSCAFWATAWAATT